MPTELKPRRPVHRPRVVARYLLLIIVPVAIAIKFYLDEQATPSDLPSIRFTRPAQWSYLTETNVRPDGSRIRYSAAALRDAFAEGRTSPLFALTKYPPPHAGFNPVMGVNIAYEDSDEETTGPVAVLTRRVEDMQAEQGDAFEIVSPISATVVGGKSAARVELASTIDAPSRREKLIVIALLSGRLSLLVAGSGTTEGADRIDTVLNEFAGSLHIALP